MFKSLSKLPHRNESFNCSHAYQSRVRATDKLMDFVYSQRQVMILRPVNGVLLVFEIEVKMEVVTGTVDGYTTHRH